MQQLRRDIVDEICDAIRADIMAMTKARHLNKYLASAYHGNSSTLWKAGWMIDDKPIKPVVTALMPDDFSSARLTAICLLQGACERRFSPRAVASGEKHRVDYTALATTAADAVRANNVLYEDIMSYAYTHWAGVLACDHVPSPRMPSAARINMLLDVFDDAGMSDHPIVEKLNILRDHCGKAASVNVLMYLSDALMLDAAMKVRYNIVRNVAAEVNAVVPPRLTAPETVLSHVKQLT